MNAKKRQIRMIIRSNIRLIYKNNRGSVEGTLAAHKKIAQYQKDMIEGGHVSANEFVELHEQALVIMSEETGRAL